MDDFFKKKQQDNRSTESRRRILKGIAAGAGVAAWHGALPSKWVSPIIEGITLPAHAQTSAPAPVAEVVQCTDLVMKQADGHSGTHQLTVSASGQFPPEYASQVFNVTFEAYKEAVITHTQEKEHGIIAVAAEMLGAPAVHAAEPACNSVVQVTVGADGAFTAETTFTCGSGIVQVLAIVRTGASSGGECCRGVLDIAGCNPCISKPPQQPVLTVGVGNMQQSTGIMTVHYTSPSGPQTATLNNNKGGFYDCVPGSQITVTVTPANPANIIATINGCTTPISSGTATFTVNAALVATTCIWGYHIHCDS